MSKPYNKGIGGEIDRFENLIEENIASHKVKLQLVEMEKQDDERRAHIRYPIQSDVLINDKFGQPVASATLFDLSTEGCGAVLHSGQITEGETFQVQFMGGVKIQSLTAEFEIKRISAVAGVTSVGMVIKNISALSRRKINDVIEQLEELPSFSS